jgi:death-on-curing protein
MTEGFIYFDIEHAIKVHNWIIDNTGGRAGDNNLGLLVSPLEHIKNDLYYSSIETKLAHLVFSINKNHAFIDGNKRSSIALGAYFLELNGYDYCVQDFVQRMENIAVWLADNTMSKELLQKIVTSLIFEDDYSEELKLEIANIINKEVY